MLLGSSPARRALYGIVVALLLVVVHGWYGQVGEAPPARSEEEDGSATAPLMPGSTATFVASAYCKGETTASGAKVRSGMAAADPRILPTGSVVHLRVDPPDHSGVYTILDTGPAVTGREIDLYMWSCYDATDFGRRQVELTVVRLGWDPSDSTAPIAPEPPARR